MGWVALLGALALSGASAQAQPNPPPELVPSARARAKPKEAATPPAPSAREPLDAGTADAAVVDAEAADAAPADAAPADAGTDVELDAASDAELEPEVPEAPPPATASAEPLPPPPPPPPASAPVLERGESAAVRIGDTPVLTLYAARGEKAPEQRARAATRALAGVIDTAESKDVRVSRQGDIAVVMVGQTPILQLGETDAKLAGDSTLDVHAANVAAQLRRAIEGERKRAAVAQLVFSISLVVFFALIAVYLMRKVGELADRLSRWLDERGEKALSIRVRDIEVLSPATLQSSAIIAVGLGKWLGQFGIFYTWLVVVLSLFEATRGYTQRLTGFVLEPLSQMMTRLATSLPLLVILVIAGLAVAVLVRFVGLFFRSVERRETVVPWVPAELAGATSVVIRLGIVLLAVVLAGPVLTGDDQGALARLAQVAVAALGLAAVPLLANGLVGAYVVFGRRLRVGQHVEVAGRSGRIAAIDLMEVRLEELGLGELRFPHLFLLRQPTRVFGLRPRVLLDVFVAPEEKPLVVLELLERVALRVGRDPRVELAAADAGALHYRITLSPDSFSARSELSLQVVDALRDEGIKLGRSTRRELFE